jgi:hypothetical protein
MMVRFSLAVIATCAVFTVLAPSASGQDEPAPKVIFEQPQLTGPAGSFHVPLAENGYPSEHPFNLLLWQPNPDRPDGQLVPTSWDAGSKTGFEPDEPLADHQLGFRDESGASTVQAEGDTIGAYLNSKDLTKGSGGDKMMITPELKLPPGGRIHPFATPGMALAGSLELQVPTAHDSDKYGNLTYVVSDFSFEDKRTRTKLSYHFSLFRDSPAKGDTQPTAEWMRDAEVGGLDGPSHSYMVGNPVATGGRLITLLAGCAPYQNQPWRGWKLFRAAITEDNFKLALQDLKANAKGFKGSLDPADYEFVGWHLNAELKYETGPAELGWSMRHAKIMLLRADQLGSLGTDAPAP